MCIRDSWLSASEGGEGGFELGNICDTSVIADCVKLGIEIVNITIVSICCCALCSSSVVTSSSGDTSISACVCVVKVSAFCKVRGGLLRQIQRCTSVMDNQICITSVNTSICIVEVSALC